MLVFKVERHFGSNPRSIYSPSHKTIYPGEGLTLQDFVEYYESNSPFHTSLNNPGSCAEEQDYSRQAPGKCLHMLMRGRRVQAGEKSPEERQEKLQFCKVHCTGQNVELCPVHCRQGRDSLVTEKGKCFLPGVRASAHFLSTSRAGDSTTSSSSA